MKKTLDTLIRLIVRFRYPVSLPEDVARALGVPLSNLVTFDDFIHLLEQSDSSPTRLSKYMPRELAENAFTDALHKEKFRDTTLCSFFFNDGWMEFILKFDDQARLRRVYIQHKDIENEQGIELKLKAS